MSAPLSPPAEAEPQVDRPAAPELFSQDQLERHAVTLAGLYRLASDPGRGRPLLPRLDDAAEELEAAYRFLSDSRRTETHAIGSEDWLRDNHHVVQDQIREIRQDLPRQYYIELPKFADGPFDGYPRVYVFARELTAHTAGRFDLQTLVDFAAAYQRVAPLTIGEIWAIPIMLRLALVEDLRRLAAEVVAARRGRDRARRWGVRLAQSTAPERVIGEMLRDEIKANGRLSAPFVVELLQWLRDQPSSAAPAWHALQRALEAQDDSPDEMLRVEHQREAADQLAIGNIITSMRLLSSIDWPLFFERVSLVERILRGDPAGAYARMDFPTRDRYRHSVEELAKRSKTREQDVAQRAVEMARESQRTAPQHDRSHHVGYYLISRGRFRLEQDVGYPPAFRERLGRFVYGHPVIGYLGAIALGVALAVASFIAYGQRHGGQGWELWLIALVVLLPVSELAISVINLLITSQITPRPLPKLDLRNGIPVQDRTFVVVPAIIDSEARLNSLLDHLEVRFFANRDPHLHFALLSDFADAPQRTQPDDMALIDTARRRIDELNARHGGDRFFLFHRARHWNPGEKRWMGHERKRGKLAEFNRLLRGATDTSFIVQHGELSILPTVRYVITLDSDTQLPMEAGRRLVGTLSHPLNQPRFDARRQRVTEGYGVLQPRISVGVVSANRTLFSQVFSGHVGVDPYTTAVSDIYQDLFGEGSYVGKGIYDVDAFEAALANRIPENTLLSHDLFEGFYARAGLVTDFDLVDDYPAHYLAYSSRQHRWVRGDWQIVRWLWRTVPDSKRRAVLNTLPVISRWKIIDNLRRSLIAPALVVLLAAGWTLLPGSPFLWMTLALLVLAFPAYVQVARSLSSHAAGVPMREHLRAEGDTMLTSLRQAVFSIVVLAHQSVTMLDAISRALFRMTISRRRLLEWVTADRAEREVTSLGSVVRRMWQGPALTIAIGALVAAVAPDRLLLASPILMLWFISPVLPYITGQPLANRKAEPSEEDRAAFRRVARKTWRFFEDLVGADDHWLVPDNYQADRAEVVAHRTSPTNIGLQLLSTLAAYDFGYVSFGRVLDRLEQTFDTLLRMQRYRGHFYNWYDTKTLAPLIPAYISTVDSGNLAGYLLTLRSGLSQIAERDPLIGGSALDAVADAIDLFGDELESLEGSRATNRLTKELDSLRANLARRPTTLLDWQRLLTHLEERLQAISVLLHDIEEPLLSGSSTDAFPPALTEAALWLERAASSVATRQGELERLTGWMMRLQAAGLHSVPAEVPSLSSLIGICDRALNELSSHEARQAIERARHYAEELIERAERIGALADDLIEETEFGFLFNAERQLFSIGFSVSDGRLDNSYYDILASEARLASFMAIATGTISHEHWFKLGRSLTPSDGSRALLSWSASMFEYLMPLIVMRSYPGTLLDETYTAVVKRQIQYGAQRGVPWGVSESAYNAQDLDKNYQYRAFGVPGLGLKRGLADDLVVAPYASVLAAPLTPDDVLANLERLKTEGAWGRFGFSEAIDYTAERIPPDHKKGVVLPTWMAHHQGMSLLAIDNLLNGSPMQNRFHSDPRIQAADLLLQERIPQLVPLKDPPLETAEHVPTVRRAAAPPVRRYQTPHTLSPRAHLLSNGSYAVMVTNAGGGYSRRQNLALTRWREDITTDAWGTFIFIRDLDTGEVWSTTHQPTAREAEEYEAVFALDRAVWRRVDSGLEVRTEVVVSPEDDAELRRVSVTNHSHRARSIDLTSYAEVVLAPGEADLAHPAFSNLFVESTAVPERDAIICARRPRSGTDRVYLVHVLSGRGRIGTATEYETDRTRFIGRGRSLANPAAMSSRGPLSNTTGPVLDPIVSLRHAVRLPPGGTARLSFTTGFADSEAGARQLVEKYYDRRAVARAIALASTHAQVEMRHLGLTVEDTIKFQRLAGRILFADPRLRSPDAVQANRRGQSELWKYGISGDLPIVLAQIADGDELPLFNDLLKAHEYLRGKGMVFDLVVLNAHGASYRQDLQNTIQSMVENGPEQAWIDRPGGVFLRRTDLIPPEDQLLLRAAARAVMSGDEGRLLQQLVRPQVPFEPMPDEKRAVVQADAEPTVVPPQPPGGDLESFNGFGGFAEDGREYVIRIQPGAGSIPPAPWTNVVAHPTFGFVASDLGTGFTWSENSHDNRLTPWRNDPVSDPPGEAVYIRDDDTGAAWSATPLPAGGGRPYTVRHGHGYSLYYHSRYGIDSRLRLFVAAAEPIKVFELALRNTSRRRRQLSITLYVEWVLGENRSRTASHIVTSREPSTGALIASNAFRDEFADRVAFLDLYAGDSRRSITGDRTEFIGRNGTLVSPAALGRTALSDRTGAAIDPCGAVQLTVTVEPGEERTVVGLLGEAADAASVSSLVRRSRAPQSISVAFEDVRNFWSNLLGTVQVKTPDRTMDLMLNGWLLYQTLACRIWGRSAFYQSSGAFGFRDQLQDVLALLFAAPHLARQHILHAASRQFVEGDVQHWWHEPGGQGVRTKFSDDRLWLVYAVMQYVSATGDTGVLDERVAYLEGRLLQPEEHEAYEKSIISQQHGTIYEHCVRAIGISLDTGEHGLPLMGTGDWNDGMNLVGAGGKGESVWLGWFLLSLLPQFADLAASRGDADLVAKYRRHIDALTIAVENAWDGEWYRRAYFDDGTPLGSKTNEECRIDSLAQSWSVLSGAAAPDRAREAMESADTHLVHRNHKLVLLLTPPFDKMKPSPGYIQGYVPGVRENGGQYTHAALWTVMAFAAMGDGDRAHELFSIVNPLNHAHASEDVLRYRTEPYVVAADVYSKPPHMGRGGWTWYTGSAAWMYRVGLESILGLRRRGGGLLIDPCIPKTWPRYEVTVRTPRAEYRIAVENPTGVTRGVARIEIDGVEHKGPTLPIFEDGAGHAVRVTLGEKSG
jgi:cyclic beta-1,2-glucan synthetase